MYITAILDSVVKLDVFLFQLLELPSGMGYQTYLLIFQINHAVPIGWRAAVVLGNVDD